MKLDVLLPGHTKEFTPVTFTDHDLSALLAAAQAGELTETVHTSLAEVLQQLIEAELTETIGAAPGERSAARSALRNGHRPGLVTTAAGDIEVGILKLRTGSFFPSILERRRRIERSLFAVVMEAWVHDVSTRKADDLVKTIGATSGVSKSEVPRTCTELDRDLEPRGALTGTTPGCCSSPTGFCEATRNRLRLSGKGSATPGRAPGPSSTG